MVYGDALAMLFVLVLVPLLIGDGGPGGLVLVLVVLVVR